MKYMLGLDNGGTVIKAALFDERGEQIASASGKAELIVPEPGHTERDMEEVWQTNLRVVKTCLERASVPAKDVVSLAISGHGKGLYAVDRSGALVAPGIVSTDSRASDIADAWAADGSEARARERTLQRTLACQPAALLRWFKLNRPEIYNKIGWVLSVKDYLRFRFTGRICAERTDMSGTSLVNLRTGDYDPELLSLFGIEELADCLPPLVSSFDDCGGLTEEAARATGLLPGTVVAGGMFDIDACALGTGLLDERDVCVIGGTWSINEYISKTPVTDGSVSMNSLYCLPGYYLLEECSPTSAGNLDWFIRMFLGAEIERAGGINRTFFTELDLLAAGTDWEPRTLFLPFLFDCNEGAKLDAGLYGLNAATSKGEIVRAVFEGVAFSHKTHLDRLLASRTPPRAVRLAGGVANSEVWTHMFADVFGLPVLTSPARELGCFGAALAGGVAAGLFRDAQEALSRTLAEGKLCQPDLKMHQKYLVKYAAYRELVRKLKS